MGRGLSDVQKDVLRSVLHYIRHVEEHGSEWAKARIGDHALRVPLHWLRGYGYNRTPSDSAAFSRSLRRLEQRGLIVRTNVTTGIPAGHPLAGRVRHSTEEPHVRTDTILLTD